MGSKAYKTIEGTAEAEIAEKKSRFIAQAAHVETEEEAVAFLEGVKAANRTARHHVYAYVLRDGGRMRYSDDGEPQKTAGMPTLEAITHAGLLDVIIVTTRYFGGVLLGTGGLVRAYSAAASDALAAAVQVTMVPCVEIALTLAYPFYEQAVRVVEAHGAQVRDSAFSDEVRLAILIPHESSQPLVEALVELTHGKADIQVSEPFDAPFG